jgi:prepilin-type N-terminal cleavage/methylation domain-containing protein
MHPGFTLLEVLIAMVLLAVLVTAIAPSLLASLRAEQTADLLQQGQLAADRIVTASYVLPTTTNSMEAAAEPWTAASRLAAPDEEGQPEWRVWEVSAAERPSLRVRFALRAKEERVGVWEGGGMGE